MTSGDIERIARELLVAIGEDPTREGLVDTPRRFAGWWREFIDYDPGNLETGFSSVTSDSMIVVRDIAVSSLCEHHLLPFTASVAIGYITGDRIIGLSKFARAAHLHAHKLQVQERLTDDIASEISQLAGVGDVAVVVKGHHACLEMRGIRTPATMITSVLRGKFRTSDALRAEFMGLVG